MSKATDKVVEKIRKLKAEKWLTASASDRVIIVAKDEEALSQISLLDGFYVIKSDVPKQDADSQTLRDRYCDLEMVERSFRTMKTTHLDLRSVFVRKKASTRGYVLVVMLALLLQRYLERSWSEPYTTVQEGIDELAAIHMQEVHLGEVFVQNIPTPNKTGRQFLNNIGVQLPSVLPRRNATVDTTKNSSQNVFKSNNIYLHGQLRLL